MRIVRNPPSHIKDNKIRIAYSICGEGHGHYGRNVETIKTLAKKLINSEITLYLYGDTYNIFCMDKELPKNVKIKKIPGFRWIYKKKGVLHSMGSTFRNIDNVGVFLRIIKLDFLHTTIFPIRKLFAWITKRPDTLINRYYMKHFEEFDYAISDLEPLLPRIADVRKKPFMTLDNQHVMLYGDIKPKQFNLNERLELFFIKNSLKVLYPFSDLSILTCFYKIPIKNKYKKYVKEVGPLIRKRIKRLKKNIEYNDYILVYAHKVLGEKLFPILTKIDNQKFIVFTNMDFNEKNFAYKRKWIEYHTIDPTTFINYLVKCKAVISTAGNTLISEAIYFKKPFFAISLEGNFEQRLNLYMLEKSKWGEGCKLSDFKEKNMLDFISNIKIHQTALEVSKILDNTNKMVNLILNHIKKNIIFEI